MNCEKEISLDDLLTRLEMDGPGQFEYFEHLADLLEMEEPVSPGVYYALFTSASGDTIRELLSNYFDDIMKKIPDDSVELYTLLSSIRTSLTGLTHGLSEPDVLRKFTDELAKFHDWYSIDSNVTCTRLSDGEELSCSVCEALALCRLESLNEDAYNYDFDECLDYDLDEYSMSLNDMMSSAWPEEPEHEHSRHCGDEHCDCQDDPASSFDAFRDGLIDPDNPVIDSEMGDDPSV